MKALIAMSGGVDSSVAAYLTQKEGFACIGGTAQMCDRSILGDAFSLQGIEDARAVARRLGMDFHVFDAVDAFQAAVIDDFISCYEQGLTPNPCVVCNRHIKFSYLLDKALELGCDSIVTGHYAQIKQDQDTGRYLLYKAVDEAKDQSYFLACLNRFYKSGDSRNCGKARFSYRKEEGQSRYLFCPRRGFYGIHLPLHRQGIS